MKEDGSTMVDVYGLNLDSKKGWYVWPYPACGARLENNLLKQYSPDEAYEICVSYCDKTDNKFDEDLYQRYKRMNVQTGKASTCKELCGVARKYANETKKEKVIEAYVREIPSNQPSEYRITLIICGILFITLVAICYVLYLRWKT